MKTLKLKRKMVIGGLKIELFGVGGKENVEPIEEYESKHLRARR